MTSIADGSVRIHTSAESVPSTPSWFGEVVLLTTYLRKHQVLAKISERVRFRRLRFGHYEVIDFLAVLFGYIISRERTLEAFYERLRPFALPFMAFFELDQVPSRSALSRFLAALTEAPVEALRTLFLDDLFSRPLVPEKQMGGVTDRAGNAWVVFDLDGTREAARQRALPQTDALPPPFRRLDPGLSPRATPGANAGKWCGHEPSSTRRIASSGSAVLGTKATGATGRNCFRGSPPLIAISRPTSSRKGVPCCHLMANMGQEPGSPRWLASRL